MADGTDQGVALLPPGWKARARTMLGWRRFRTVGVTCLLIFLLLLPTWAGSKLVLLTRLLTIGLMAMLAFGFWEQWPRRLPRWMARWVLQVVAVGLTIPPVVLALYVYSTPDGGPPLWQDRQRLSGLASLTITGLLIGPWVALGALVRQKEAFARHQALGFALERSELERSAAEARLQLLQAQVQPHFLFNTLANVRALVETGSPRALAVLDSLIAYLRAAVPRLNAPAASLGDEMALVRAYLDIMQMRMPDRLSVTIDVPDALLAVACPPMSVLTLVENAVRHGIDPAEEGGEIRITGHQEGGVCRIEVADSGVGLRAGVGGLGTGLSTLRQRLSLAYGTDAWLMLEERASGGVVARLFFPTQRVTA